MTSFYFGKREVSKKKKFEIETTPLRLSTSQISSVTLTLRCHHIDILMSTNGELLNRLVESIGNEITKDKVLNVYLVGSRLWKVAGKDSDFDVIVVVDNTSDKLTTSLCGGLFDVCIMGKPYFIDRLLRHHFQEMICAFIPVEFVWKSEFDAISFFKLDKK